MTSAGGTAPAGRLRWADLQGDPQLYGILLDHASRGIRVQTLLRALLVVFLAVTVLAVPPAHERVGCYVTVAVYAVWSVAVAGLSQRGSERALRVIWLALFVDLIALVLLSLLASVSDAQSWTADILVNGFFLIPMLATTQLRPWVGITITLPGLAAYFATSAAARYANTEPWSSVGLRTGVLASLSLACVLLCAVQRSRVLTIAGLVSDRAELTGQLVDVEGQARRQLAEELHDGALQYVLAARQDLEDARAGAGTTSFDRVDFALRETTSLLRAKVSQLHPAVLAQAGLLRALEDLVRATAERSGAAVTLESRGWDDGRRTGVDEIVYGAARELLTNVGRHAHAQKADVRLDVGAASVTLTVADDGAGLSGGVLQTRLAEGHVGLASQRVRIEAAGGRLVLKANPAGSGTVATVELPLPAS